MRNTMRVLKIAGRRHDRSGAALLGAMLGLGLLVTGCADDKAPVAAAAPVVAAPAMGTPVAPSPAEIASAQIPIPLPSPKHLEGIRVASIDPRAGVSALGSMPGLAPAFINYDIALAGAETSKLRTPKEVRKAIKALAIFAPEDLADGWFDTQARIAARNELFAQGVRSELRAKGKSNFLAALETEENYAFGLPGAGAATSDVIASVAIEDRRMKTLSARFIAVAYQFQKQKWGMSTPMTGVNQFASAAPTPSHSLSWSDFSPISSAQAYSPNVMKRILVLGARQVIDASETTATDDATGTARCLNWAKLNLSQCLAAARFPSEEAWCAGTHAVGEVQACFASALPAAVAKP